MNYPLLSDYIEAIKAAEDNFEQLKNLRPVLGADGEPIFSSGNFAVVFKMKDEQTGKLHAVKCFLREQEGRAEAYRQIAEELEYVSSTFLTPIKYLDKELFVDTNASDDTEFPVLLMDWVEGETLDKYIRKHLNDQYELSLLAYQFSRLAMWLMPQPFAHGDLKPDNILVKSDGTLVLVDYDGMYVPAMKGQRARELGSPDFRHPSRTESDFDEHIDDFSLASILLSLKAISLRPSLLEEYGASDRLLFSANDYHDISRCDVLKKLFPHINLELDKLIGVFSYILADNNAKNISFRCFIIDKPSKTSDNLLDCYSVSHDDDWVDNNGMHYSKDKKILIGPIYDWLLDEEYNVLEGTETISSGAFIRDEHSQWFEPNILKRIVIPASVKEIKCCSIPGNYSVICQSEYFKWYKKGLYTSDYRELVYYPFAEGTNELELHPNTNRISFNFIDDVDYCSDSYGPRYWYYPTTVLYQATPNVRFNLPENTLLCVPKGTSELFEKLGYDKSRITESCVYIDEFGVVYSYDKRELLAFPFNSSLEQYEVIDTCEIIRDNAFKKLLFQINSPNVDDETFVINQLRSLTLPRNLREIGKDAFQGCYYLKTIKLPQTITKIGEGAFDGCSSLVAIYISLGEKDKIEKFLPNYINIIIECLDTGIDYSNDIEKRKQIEEAYKGLEQQWNTESEQNSGFYEELDESFKEDLIVMQDDNKTIKTQFVSNEVIIDRELQIKSPNGQFGIIDVKERYMEGSSWRLKYDYYNIKENNQYNISDIHSIEYNKDNDILKISFNKVLDNGYNTICFSRQYGNVHMEFYRYHILVNELDSRFNKAGLPLEELFYAFCSLSQLESKNAIVTLNGEAFQVTYIQNYYSETEMRNLDPLESVHFIYDVINKESHSTEVTDEVFANAWTDEYGVKYSADKKYLIESPVEETKKGIHIWKKGILYDSYNIHSDTVIICDKAFFDCRGLTSIKCPKSLQAIGKSAFQNCWSLNEVNLNYGLLEICDNAFKDCKSLKSIHIPGSISYIASNAFEGSGIGYIYTDYGDVKRVKTILPQYENIIIEELPF